MFQLLPYVELWSCGAVELWSSYLIFWGSDYLKKISKYLFTSGKKQRRTKKKHREEDAWSIAFHQLIPHAIFIEATYLLRLCNHKDTTQFLLRANHDDIIHASKPLIEPVAELRSNLQVCAYVPMQHL